MDFCQRFGPEIAYCLEQPLRGYNVNTTCVCERALLFPWGVMAVEVCIGSAGTIRHCAHWFRLVCVFVCLQHVCVCTSIVSLVYIYR